MNPSFLPSLFFNDCWQRCPTPFIIKRLLRYRQDRGGFSALLLSGDIYFLEALSLSLSRCCCWEHHPACIIVLSPGRRSHCVALLLLSLSKCKRGRSIDGVKLHNDADQLATYLNQLLCVYVCVLPFVSVCALCVSPSHREVV